MWNPKSFEDSDFGLADDERFEPDELEEMDTVSLDEPHIMTLLGPIAPSELGICLPHVHVLCDPPGADEDHRLIDTERAEEEIEQFITMNGRSLVDGTTADMGRMIPQLLEIAGWVPAHIIASTGRGDHRLAGVMQNATNIDSLTEEFVADLTVGMEGTRARAGVIKVGTSPGEITDVERASLSAAVAAHHASRASITARTAHGTMVRDVLDDLTGQGVPAHQIILGNLDSAPLNLDELRAIGDSGAYLQFDQLGKSGDYPDEHRADMIARLCDAGYQDQILLGLDYHRRSQLTAYDGGPGLPYLSEWFMISLMRAGLDAMTIRKIVVDNPARALTIHPRQA